MSNEVMARWVALRRTVARTPVRDAPGIYHVGSRPRGNAVGGGA